MEGKSINELLGIGNSQELKKRASFNQRSKYPALMIISNIFKALAWITGIVAVIASIMVYDDTWELLTALLVIFSGGLLVLSLTAISELIKVLIDIEYNTRKM